MPSPTRRPRSRAFSPSPEALEGRQLLAKVISGVDLAGDQWTLHLIGPGDLSVTTQDDVNGNPVPLTSRSQINQITVVGANPDQTRLVGKVIKAPGSDGRVFFQNLTEIGEPATTGTSGIIGNGLKSVDMPNFYLGDTLLNPTAALTAQTAPAVRIPDGVISFRIGGVDTTAYFGQNPAFAPTAPATAASTSVNYLVNLGLPRTVGTTIIVDKITSSAQAGFASGTATRPTPIQQEVDFAVTGRINLFQANQIVGSTNFPSTGRQGGGGTVVASVPSTTGAVGGVIADVRVGGNATNFSVVSDQATGVGGGQIQSYYVGGETNNLQLLATTNIRTITFGRGMDTVTINANDIQSISANRGALNSNVTTNGPIGRFRSGGDVVNTKVLSGYTQQLAALLQAAPTTNPTAQPGGRIDAFIAGNVTDSVFAAGVQPGSDGFFGSPEALFFPGSHLFAKVEGTISNAGSTSVISTAKTAFFAHDVLVTHGPVTPPANPEAPFRRFSLPRQALGLQYNGIAQEGLRAEPTAAPPPGSRTNLGGTGRGTGSGTGNTTNPGGTTTGGTTATGGGTTTTGGGTTTTGGGTTTTGGGTTITGGGTTITGGGTTTPGR